MNTESPVLPLRDDIKQTLTFALVGNPNCGKTTLFNALTGLRQKVGNYAGVTVEKKEGRLNLPEGGAALLIDLPGLYSLTPHSPDEVIAREVLMGLRDDTPAPDLVINVVDASNLDRNLYLTSQLLDLGLPVVIALTMTDALDKEGRTMDAAALEKAIGVPVITIIAAKRTGLDALRERVTEAKRRLMPEVAWKVTPEARAAVAKLQTALQAENPAMTPRVAFAEAVSLLMQESEMPGIAPPPAPLRKAVRQTQENLAAQGIDFAAQVIEARYEWIAAATAGITKQTRKMRRTPLSFNERIDRVVMHPLWGYVIFFVVMALVFQSIFTWAQGPMDALKNGVNHLASLLTRWMPPGDLRDLLRDGVFGGVGNAIVFLPQILMLFFFISVLEDTGYMARAAFLMDRLMSKVGLHGKSFIPLLSSFACAIPAIMATRTIGDRKARLITILVAPLMSCSARLPVYTLMIGAFIPARPVLKIGPLTLLSLPGLTLISMYFMGMAVAFCIAWLFHRTLLKGVAPAFLMELPPYRLPSLKTALYQMVERAWLFLARAATVILAISVASMVHGDLPQTSRTAAGAAGGTLVRGFRRSPAGTANQAAGLRLENGNRNCVVVRGERSVRLGDGNGLQRRRPGGKRAGRLAAKTARRY